VLVKPQSSRLSSIYSGRPSDKETIQWFNGPGQDKYVLGTYLGPKCKPIFGGRFLANCASPIAPSTKYTDNGPHFGVGSRPSKMVSFKNFLIEDTAETTGVLTRGNHRHRPQRRNGRIIRPSFSDLSARLRGRSA
jgi:hypothetical protein